MFEGQLRGLSKCNIRQCCFNFSVTVRCSLSGAFCELGLGADTFVRLRPTSSLVAATRTWLVLHEIYIYILLGALIHRLSLRIIYASLTTHPQLAGGELETMDSATTNGAPTRASMHIKAM